MAVYYFVFVPIIIELRTSLVYITHAKYIHTYKFVSELLMIMFSLEISLLSGPSQHVICFLGTSGNFPSSYRIAGPWRGL